MSFKFLNANCSGLRSALEPTNDRLAIAAASSSWRLHDRAMAKRSLLAILKSALCRYFARRMSRRAIASERVHEPQDQPEVLLELAFDMHVVGDLEQALRRR